MRGSSGLAQPLRLEEPTDRQISGGQEGYGLGMLPDGRLFLTKVDVDFVDSRTMQLTDSAFHHAAVTKSGRTVIFYLDGVAGAPVTYTVSLLSRKMYRSARAWMSSL